jgi:hypothetical protein
LLDEVVGAVDLIRDFVRHNNISSTLSTAPDRFEPMHRGGKPNGDVDPRPLCQGLSIMY